MTKVKETFKRVDGSGLGLRLADDHPACASHARRLESGQYALATQHEKLSDVLLGCPIKSLKITRDKDSGSYLLSIRVHPDHSLFNICLNFTWPISTTSAPI